MSHDGNQWLIRAINLLFKSFVNQKCLPVESAQTESEMLNERLNEVNSAKSKADAKSSIQSGSKKTEQDVITSKAEQFNKMYYESMKNKFYEVTEGVKSNPSPWKTNEGATLKKELEAMLTANECKVLHPVRKDFNRILESTLLSLQKQIRKRKPVLQTNSDRKQTLHITDVDKFMTDLNFMQSSSLCYLINTLLDMIKDGKEKCDVRMMQQLLYLMNLSKNCDANLDRTVYSNLSETIIFIFKSPIFFNESFYSLKKQMINFVLQTNNPEALQAQFHLLELHELELHDNNDNARSNSLMLFKDLMIRENLLENERVLVKKLLVKQISCQ